MAIEPVKIPQNVYVEDRIIGPVTLKQLAMVGIGMGISYAIFASVNKNGTVGIPISVAWSAANISLMSRIMVWGTESALKLGSKQPSSRFRATRQTPAPQEKDRQLYLSKIQIIFLT